AVSGGVAYGLKYQARCIANVTADSHNTSFLLGTLSPRDDNEVHFIQLSPFGTELTCEGLYLHPHEIWDLASCPFDLHIFTTVYASGGKYGASLWRIPELSMHHNAPQLEQLASLDGHTHKIKWRGSAEKPACGPSSKGTSGTRVREGPEPAGSPETNNCSTRTVRPEGRAGREKPTRPKREENQLTARNIWDKGTQTARIGRNGELQSETMWDRWDKKTQIGRIRRTGRIFPTKHWDIWDKWT
ncbi:hypothetical protein KI387_024039, partial [Taxus chinensis]